ncbi:MAG: class I SAM-dependent methyltransferase [Sphaerochaetaceae bacterium]|jgi:ubiquinone/menaquinone biosynthesis C-methylase UbiE|nr:class I SAM-dependent methyltransferase [Sphaerochaetaceae bacterium]MDX9933756.1 class I SAM-dependent methyltransferase [Sphaerochaetaceae bacterium]
MAKDLFNSIAHIYGWFHRYQMKRFAQILDSHGDKIPLAHMQTVCDVGCGTGALCAVLGAKGLTVTGIDAAQRMLEVAKKKVRHPNVTFVQGEAGKGLSFPDSSFDVVFTSYVAHGIAKEKRKAFYTELKRIATKAVIIQDYDEERSLATTIIEWLEHGDYFRFIQHPQKEMEEVFPVIIPITVGKQACWYVCHCPSKELTIR